MPSKTKLKHFLPGQIRFSCVCWRIWETDQDGPGEIHWNFASRNTMPARLADCGRIWPLPAILKLLALRAAPENFQYQTFVTKYLELPISNPRRKSQVVKYQIQFFYLEKEIAGRDVYDVDKIYTHCSQIYQEIPAKFLV